MPHTALFWSTGILNDTEIDQTGVISGKGQEKLTFYVLQKADVVRRQRKSE
jgi:hypothetical protein